MSFPTLKNSGTHSLEQYVLLAVTEARYIILLQLPLGSAGADAPSRLLGDFFVWGEGGGEG